MQIFKNNTTFEITFNIQMFLRFLGRLLAWLLGWNIAGDFPPYKKCIIAAAPHTSMYDFFLGKIYFWSKGVKIRFIIKKELFWFPFGLILRAVGGMPVNRGAKNNMVEHLEEIFNSREEYKVLFTPEGTRKKVTRWKKGFLVLAHRTQLPVVLGYLDYKLKKVDVLSVFHPTGNHEKDLMEIQKMYKGITAKYPENFSAGDD
jgi:1-acyl-sn-glycerol-3-phosphate acyltransferase